MSDYLDDDDFGDIYNDESQKAGNTSPGIADPKRRSKSPDGTAAATTTTANPPADSRPQQIERVSPSPGVPTVNAGAYAPYPQESAYPSASSGPGGVQSYGGGRLAGGFLSGPRTVTPAAADDHGPAPGGIREDGKMFIGGLNWETTDSSLREYFSQFGEVVECTVMRDGATGRSRGFGFLTFRDPKTVNIVMVKEHYLDGKIIDPKRAIPREEQDKTSKIFVGGVGQDVTDDVFRTFFADFGRVVDATLMMDKDTGRPRGFGFVTFENEDAVEACLEGPLQIRGKPIEVKRAEPRNGREDKGKFSSGPGQKGGYNRGGAGGMGGGASDYDGQAGQGGGGQGQMGMPNMPGMTPAMMAQYWQKMQQYFMMYRMNPGHGPSPGGMMNMMGQNPNMQLQMQQYQQQMLQQQMQQQQMHRTAAMQQRGMGMQHQTSTHHYQHQQTRNGAPSSPYGSGQAGLDGGNGRSEEYREGADSGGDGAGEEVGGSRGGGGRYVGSPGQNGSGSQSSNLPTGPRNPNAAPPANAPTGPKNPGRGTTTYRGGGRGGHRGYHPYAR